jgi:polyhydroxybutyrate depolymerase
MTIAFFLLFAAMPGKTMHWTIGGIDREATVYRSSVASRRPPLLIFFHGHGGNPQRAAERYYFHKLWPEAIVVYPQGLPTPSPVDPAGKDSGWQREAAQLGDRDVKLFDAIVASFPKNGGVFVAGHSNGAFMSYVLWAERASLLKGVGLCAGKLIVNVTTPVAVVHIAGEKDPLVKIDEQMKSMEDERRIDGCIAPPRPCGDGCNFYPSRGHTPEEGIVHPGGHDWPAWATQRIVEFFRHIP